MRIAILLLLFLNVSCGYKFLVYSPLFFHSMCKWIGKIADTLTEAGHDVTVLMPVIEPSLIEKTGVKLTKKKIVVPGDEKFVKFVEDNVEGLFQDSWSQEQGPFELIHWGRKLKSLFSGTCDMLLTNKTLLADLKNEHFDVAIAEPFYLCGFGLFEHLKISKVIAASSTTLFEKVSYVLGEPVTPSYVPSMEWAGGVPKTMKERAMNAFGSYGATLMLDYIYEGESEVLRKHFGDSFSGAEEVVARSSVHFTQSNPYLDFPKAKIHKTVELGGITANIEKTAVMDEKFDKILSLRPKTVLISFGTVCLSKDMPEKYKKTIVKVMESFPEVTFIWKYEEETDISKHLPNVHMVKWQPQTALLADPRLSMFITHGGLGSTLELAHSGKPAITIPVIADQPRNSAMLARHGGTINLPKEDLQSPHKLKEAVQKILNDKSYAIAAERLERMLKEQPVSAKDLLLLHAEYVAKFGPLTMLDPYGRHLSIFEYYLVDIVASILFVVVLILLIVVHIAHRCVNSFNRKRKIE